MERGGKPSSENIPQRDEAPVVQQPQPKSNELAVPAQQAETIEVFTAQHSVQEDQGQQESIAPPRRRAGPSYKPPERAPSGELYRGSLIRQLREARGLQTREVEAQVGYHRNSLGIVEQNRGNLSQEKLQLLAQLLGVPVAELEQAPVHPRTKSSLPPGKAPKPPEVTETGEMYSGH